MAVSSYTAERVQKAKTELDDAREAVARAQSRLIEAQRRHNDALSAWEREFFASTEKAKD